MAQEYRPGEIVVDSESKISPLLSPLGTSPGS
jgi:hypothetical protein